MLQIEEIPAKPKEKKLIRVAAYARVSSEKDAAFHSLEAQTEYYKNYVAAHEDWKLVGIYSDNGISGTIINRPEFQRMLDDCRAGKIDLVVTKSVTRFARNTVILLQTVRELKALGINCFFEKENLYSISPDGELLLTLLAMYAEEEARSASENQLWRVRKRFEQGKPWVGNLLGYRLVNGKMIIVPEEAKIVRQIYADYLSGMGRSAIANKLLREGVTTEYVKRWSGHYIADILRNEKYVGNMMLQKTFRPDFCTKKDKINHGEVRRYFVKGSHEPIVDEETFAAVQREIAKRKSYYKTNQRNEENASPFTGLIVCGICGHNYIRKHFCGKYGKTAWLCNEYYRHGCAFCPSQKIPESILIQKAEEVLGINGFTHECLAERLIKIVIPCHNHIAFHFKTGDVVDVPWKHPSRSQSWTPEMKEAARLKTKQRQRKED